MKFWQTHLKEIPGPSALVGFVNLFFILLLIFLLGSQFVTMAGILSKSVALLPAMKSADIKMANKIIVSVTRKEMQVTDAVTPVSEAQASATHSVVTYEYAFNGEVVQDAEALRPRLAEEIRLFSYLETDQDSRPDEVMIVLMASKDIPYEKLIDFYKLCRDFRVPLYLAVNDGASDNLPRQLQGGQE